jgi:hypothetical protein
MPDTKQELKKDTKDTLDLGILDAASARFYITDGGFTGLKTDDKDYPHITLRRTMPIQAPMKYISVADSENKEIGILRDVDELSAEQKEIVIKELDNRYYSPDVLEVLSVKDKLGYVYIEMRVKNRQGREYSKSCAIKDVNRNIRMLTDKSLILFDVDGNRYVIQDIFKLDKLSIKKLDPYLF